MFSLQRLMGKEDKFFDLLEASAQESRSSVQALIRFMKNQDELKTLDEFVMSRRKEKKINDEISEALCKTFVTALEREDIEALSVALYKIPKTMEKIGERILLAPHLFKGVDLTRQVTMLEKATDTLVTMIQELRKSVNLEKIRTHNDQAPPASRRPRRRRARRAPPPSRRRRRCPRPPAVRRGPSAGRPVGALGQTR